MRKLLQGVCLLLLSPLVLFAFGVALAFVSLGEFLGWSN
ncbi:hypothetical protein Tam1G_1616 [Bifidobacterium imperatoris]|uniref:Uncharacterized protein n=1 Tax=Bifidobacterium imperatoris TaxID=2020965 RepID=A0A2N5IQW8_9BIFI|nr:hypothetical protein Tam1G_1616 [Bifidobacterium imperatoris]